MENVVLTELELFSLCFGILASRYYQWSEYNGGCNGEKSHRIGAWRKVATQITLSSERAPVKLLV